MIDYAHHLIKIENLARKASFECLDRKYLQAKETADLIAAEARLLTLVVQEMDKKEKEPRGHHE